MESCSPGLTVSRSGKGADGSAGPALGERLGQGVPWFGFPPTLVPLSGSGLGEMGLWWADDSSDGPRRTPAGYYLGSPPTIVSLSSSEDMQASFYHIT